MLCSTCRILIDDWDTSRHDTINHHATVDALMQAWQDGCYVCTAIAEDLQSELGFRDGESLSKPLLYQRTANKRFTVFVNHKNGFVSGNWSYTVVDSSATPFTLDSKMYEDKHVMSREIPPNIGSPAVGSLAHAWFYQCLQSHETCRHRRSHNVEPLRLLDISTDSPRLTLTSSLDGPVDFATLSHCWGSTPFLTLTRDSMPTYERTGFPLSDLPQNFRDAIQVCRWLKVRYLWIDSLCIFQGNGPEAQADWIHHVQLMGRIYASAIVCISTAAAADATTSCFNDRNARAIAPVAITIHGKSHYLIGHNHALRGYRDSIIASRAWVLQERLFSSRILTIGRQQVFWECNNTHELNVCETFPNGLKFGAISRGPFTLPEISLEAAFRSRTPAYLQWIELVEIYTQCQLTKPNEDKLAAFSGIARALGESVGSPPYVAGFFAPEFPIALAWTIHPSGQVPQSRPKVKSGIYRSPSWSWAATDAPVFLARWPGSVGREVFVEFISYMCTPAATDDEFGQLLHAEITIRASLIPFTWEEDDLYCYLHFPDTVNPSVMWPYSNYHTPHTSLALDCLDDRIYSQGEIYLLPILSDSGVCGIIVRPVTTDNTLSDTLDKRVYTRMGGFTLFELDLLEAFDHAAASEIILV